MVSHNLWAQNQKIVIHGIWNPRACFSKAISFLVIWGQETWNCSAAEFTIIRHCCLFVYFLLIGSNFKLGADGEKFTFSFPKCRTSRKFCQPFNQPFVHGYFSKAQTLFYGSSEDGKSRLLQSTVTDAACWWICCLKDQSSDKPIIQYFSSIEDRDASDCQLTFEQYCSYPKLSQPLNCPAENKQ